MATHHYTRGIAFAALGKVNAAYHEAGELARCKALVPADRVLHNNTCCAILTIAQAMLDGEIKYREGKSV